MIFFRFLHYRLGIQQICVLGMPDARLYEVVAAVVIGAEAHDWHAILARLRGRLAGYKLPRAIYSAREFPLTATNKVQRAVLKQQLLRGELARVV